MKCVRIRIWPRKNPTLNVQKWLRRKRGVELKGVRAVNPVTGDEIPIFISDYVLATYGTGAIMAVPGHDTRDWEFAKKFSLPIIEVVAGGDVDKEAFTDCETGMMVNSGFLNGLTVENAISTITKWLSERGLGEEKVNYKLRDWVFSRQRYWGEPIPIVTLATPAVMLRCRRVSCRSFCRMSRNMKRQIRVSHRWLP